MQRAFWRSVCLLALFVVWQLPGCGGSFAPEKKPALGTYQALLTASEAAGRFCSTSSVNGLTQQLFKELNCIRANTLASFKGLSGVSPTSSNVNLFLQPAAIASLRTVLGSRGGSSMRITSALRSLAQQYLLYQWYRRGRCGIGLAASPGNSNHETGIALDVSNYSSWRPNFTGRSWRWLGSRDPVHFDYRGGGIVSLRGLSIKAFQRLWNKNNSSDKIAEDGAYGPATEARLAKSPAGGFAKSGCQTQPTPKLLAKLTKKTVKGAMAGAGGAAYSLCPGQAFSLEFSFQNKGNTNWADTGRSTPGKSVRLGLKSGETFGVASRVSLKQASVKDVKPNQTTVFTLRARAGSKMGLLKTEWQLIDGASTWFGPSASESLLVTSSPPGAGENCNTGFSGPCRAGKMRCQNGSLSCVSNVPGSPESCDGKDNDCDGRVDNGNPGGGGSCAPVDPKCSRGVSRCVQGQLRCIAMCNDEPPPESKSESRTESTREEQGQAREEQRSHREARSEPPRRDTEQRDGGELIVFDEQRENGILTLEETPKPCGGACPTGEFCFQNECARVQGSGCACALNPGQDRDGFGWLGVLTLLLLGFGRRRKKMKNER